MEAVLEEIDTVLYVSLAGWGIGPQEIKLLANRIATNTTLLSLSLANNQVGLEGARYLAASLKLNSTLASLDLSRNMLGNDGAILVSDAILTHNTSLSELNLSGNGLGHEGVVSVDRILVGSSVVWLDLTGNMHDSSRSMPLGGGEGRVGIGIIFKRSGGWGDGDMYEVERLVEGGSASASGEVRVGDLLLSIEGRSMMGASDDHLRLLMLGMAGTEVSFEILQVVTHGIEWLKQPKRVCLTRGSSRGRSMPGEESQSLAHHRHHQGRVGLGSDRPPHRSGGFPPAETHGGAFARRGMDGIGSLAWDSLHGGAVHHVHGVGADVRAAPHRGIVDDSGQHVTVPDPRYSWRGFVQRPFGSSPPQRPFGSSPPQRPFGYSTLLLQRGEEDLGHGDDISHRRSLGTGAYPSAAGQGAASMSVQTAVADEALAHRRSTPGIYSTFSTVAGQDMIRIDSTRQVHDAVVDRYHSTYRGREDHGISDGVGLDSRYGPQPRLSTGYGSVLDGAGQAERDSSYASYLDSETDIMTESEKGGRATEGPGVLDHESGLGDFSRILETSRTLRQRIMTNGANSTRVYAGYIHSTDDGIGTAGGAHDGFSHVSRYQNV